METEATPLGPSLGSPHSAVPRSHPALRDDSSYRRYILQGQRPLTMQTPLGKLATPPPRHRPPPLSVEPSTDALLGTVERLDPPELPWEGKAMRPRYYEMLGVDRAASPSVIKKVRRGLWIHRRLCPTHSCLAASLGCYL